MREMIRSKLEELKGIRTNLHENDFLLTWGQSESDLRAVLMTAEILEHFYQTKHPCPELMEKFVYGLPELNRSAIRDAKYVASPGSQSPSSATSPPAHASRLRAPPASSGSRSWTSTRPRPRSRTARPCARRRT